MPCRLWADAVASAGANQRSDTFSARVTTAGKKGRVECHRQSSARLTSWEIGNFTNTSKSTEQNTYVNH